MVEMINKFFNIVYLKNLQFSSVFLSAAEQRPLVFVA